MSRKLARGAAVHGSHGAASADSPPATHESDAQVRATFEGEPIVAPAGSSVAAALIASGRPAWRPTASGASRGVFCGIGACFDCLVTINGESGQRACMVTLQPEMQVEADEGRECSDE